MNTKKELIVQKEPKSPVSEVFRTLRTNIQFMNTNKKLKTLLLTSTFQGEGKSWVSSNLAVTFAQAGNKVILIDADMRKGRLYTIFGASPRPGLSNYLSGIDIENPDDVDISQYLQRTEVENLLLMSAGNIPPNPSELLGAPQMIKLLEDLKEVCDIIIIDGTPCELVTDSIILSRIVDSTVIVTAHKGTKKENLKRVIKNIKSVGGHLAGVVINKIPTSAKKYNDRYYYGSYTQPTTRSGIRKVERDALLEEEIRRKVDGTSRKNSDAENIENSENDLEKPEFINNERNVDEVIKKTNDIINQLNEYIDNEKNNMK